MKTFKIILMFNLLFLFLPISSLFAQSQPVLYMCVNYDSQKGEISISDRFTVGYLTAVVKCDYELGLTDVSIQFDKYNFTNGQFEYYKKFNYTVDPDMSYIYFSRNDESDMSFDEPGFYRVFLLDESDKTVASCLVEIIPN